LVYDTPPALSSMRALAVMLSKPAAAASNTKLSIRLQLTSAKEDEDYVAAWPAALAEVSAHVESLDIPAVSVVSSMENACKALPGLQVLTLRISSRSEVGEPEAIDYADDDVDEDDINFTSSVLCKSHLQTLVLSMGVGQPPARLFYVDFSPFGNKLDLSGMPALSSLVLRGPICKYFDVDGADQEDIFDFLEEVPFCLPNSAKVC